MYKSILAIVWLVVCLGNPTFIAAKEYHVSPTGNDAGTGCLDQPFRTINHAAQVALPGDTVTVHNGVYREWVNPLNGGESAQKRILYRVAEGEKAEIKGSEEVKGWEKEKNGVWKKILPNTFFGNHNPFLEKLQGDWLWSEHVYHTGDIYLNDVSLYETTCLDKVFSPDTIRSLRDPHGTTCCWYAIVDSEHTTLYANFGEKNPNQEMVEVSVRPTCFYPTRQGLNYITIRGFHFSQAATQWAAPTAEQIGMVGTHWCTGWIIEENVIRNSRSNGISLGKERGSGHNLECNDKRLDGTLHYLEVIFNVLRRGWNKDYIGSHIVRNNIISDCEQTGICGSMGGAFCEIYGNHIYNIHVKRQFGGAEMAGIKLHGAIDTYIHHNRIHLSGNYGIWLDWMAQGARVSSNLLYDNSAQDLFFEVDHGPYIVDNNICLSARSIQENTDGGAFLHNLFAGDIIRLDDSRYTPYHLNHSTEIKGIRTITEGDHRFYNNLFTGGDQATWKYGLAGFEASQWPIYAEDNIFYGNAKPMKGKPQGMVVGGEKLSFRIEEKGDEVYLHINWPDSLPRKGKQVDTRRLGVTKLSGFRFENPDGSGFVLTTDYNGTKRTTPSPVIGPWEVSSWTNHMQVWKANYKSENNN